MPDRPERCGQCSACLTVRATQKLVLSETRPCGPGVNDATVRMWNTVLRDNPCNGDPSTGDAIRANEAKLRERRAEEKTEARRTTRANREFFGKDW